MGIVLIYRIFMKIFQHDTITLVCNKHMGKKIIE